MGCPYVAVGMQRALHSAIGLPRSSTSASRMLEFLMPADVSRSLMLPPGVKVSGWRYSKTPRTAHQSSVAVAIEDIRAARGRRVPGLRAQRAPAPLRS
jgi:hypothetical protein